MMAPQLVTEYIHPDAPTDYGTGRRCAKCRGKVERYATPYPGGHVLCGTHERERSDLGVPLHRFAGVERVGRATSYQLPRLGKIRREKGLRQQDLAREAECATEHVRKIEQGHNKAAAGLAGRMARVLGVEVRRLRGI